MDLQRRTTRRLAALPLALVAGLAVVPASAQTAAEKAAAEALFDEGKRLVDAGRVVEACPKFEESQRLDAGLGTMLYLADCYERAGRTASAWATFREAAAAARAAGQADREQIARARAEALEPRLHRLALRVEDASDGLTLERVDASGRRETLARATWGVALPIDPGNYRLEASAPGKTPWSTSIVVPGTPGTSTAAVPPLPVAAAAPSPSVSPAPAPAPAPPRAEDPGTGETQRTLGIVLGVVGVASLGLSGVFTAIAVSNDGEAEDLCPGDLPACADPDGVSASEDAVVMGNAATATLIAGGALLATGVVLYLTAPDAARATTTARPRPWVGVTPAAPRAEAGVSLGGTF